MRSKVYEATIAGTGDGQRSLLIYLLRDFGAHFRSLGVAAKVRPVHRLCLDCAVAINLRRHRRL